MTDTGGLAQGPAGPSGAAAGAGCAAHLGALGSGASVMTCCQFQADLALARSARRCARLTS